MNTDYPDLKCTSIGDSKIFCILISVISLFLGNLTVKMSVSLLSDRFIPNQETMPFINWLLMMKLFLWVEPVVSKELPEPQ